MNHSALEDARIFPSLKGAPKGKLPHETIQRQAFKSSIQPFITYRGSTKGEEYDPTKLCALINAFAEPFVSHLHKEIPVLLDLNLCDEEGSKALLAVIDNLGRARRQQLRKTSSLFHLWSWQYVTILSREQRIGQVFLLGLIILLIISYRGNIKVPGDSCRAIIGEIRGLLYLGRSRFI